MPDEPLGIYLHVPFCTRRCDYCDFFVVVGRTNLLDAYVERLARSIGDGARRLVTGGAVARPGGGSFPDRAERPSGSRPVRGRPRADTVYIGGGTPSLLDGSRIGRLLGACRESFDLDPAAEITMEANPEGIDEERLFSWRSAGVNRLSIGIQSIRDATLRARGRLHTGEAGLDALTMARAAGFTNIGVDLIVGLPSGPAERGMTGGSSPAPGVVAETAEAAREVVARRPDHVSVYLHETDKDTPLMAAARAGRVALPDDDEVAEAFEAVRGILLAAGYEHYEISSFCLPGRRSRHNLKYWTGQPWLGFGPSAASMIDGRLATRPRDLDGFMEGRDVPVDQTPPTPEAAAREALVLHLRLLEGVDVAEFDRLRGTSLEPELRSTLGDLESAGCVTWSGPRLSLTERGVLLANELFSRVTHGSPAA